MSCTDCPPAGGGSFFSLSFLVCFHVVVGGRFLFVHSLSWWVVFCLCSCRSGSFLVCSCRSGSFLLFVHVVVGRLTFLVCSLFISEDPRRCAGGSVGCGAGSFVLSFLCTVEPCVRK